MCLLPPERVATGSDSLPVLALTYPDVGDLRAGDRVIVRRVLNGGEHAYWERLYYVSETGRIAYVDQNGQHRGWREGDTVERDA